MKIIPLKSISQKVDEFKKEIELTLEKKIHQDKSIQKAYFEMLEKFRTNSQDLTKDVELAEKCHSKSRELQDMVESNMDSWDLNYNLKTIIQSFIKTNKILANNYQATCVKSMELYTEEVGKIAHELFETKKANTRLISEKLEMLEFQYAVLTKLQKAYEIEIDPESRILLHEKLSRVFSSIEENKFIYVIAEVLLDK